MRRLVGLILTVCLALVFSEGVVIAQPPGDSKGDPKKVLLVFSKGDKRPPWFEIAKSKSFGLEKAETKSSYQVTQQLAEYYKAKGEKTPPEAMWLDQLIATLKSFKVDKIEIWVTGATELKANFYVFEVGLRGEGGMKVTLKPML